MFYRYLDISSEVCATCLDEFSRIRIQKYLGDLLIHAHSFSYVSSPSVFFHEVSDELLLSVGYSVESDSQKYILYFHPENSLQINLFFGSGNFRFQSNDTAIGELIVSKNDAFTVIPKGLGTLRIEVTDEVMIKARTFVCTIFIVQCHKAKMTLSPSIFQEQDYTKVEIYLYDAHENLIPVPQMKFVNFWLDVFSFTDINQRDLFKISKSHNFNQFIAQGLKAGSYRFVVYVENYLKNETKTVAGPISHEDEVHVYEKLSTIPNSLLLAPGCNCHIEVIGGPSEKAKITSNIELRTRVSDDRLLHLTKQEQNLFLGEGHGVGSGKVFFELVQRDNNLTLSVYEVDLRVELVNHIEIMGFPERRVFLGATFRLLALRKFI